MLLFVESVSKTSKRNGVVQTKVTYLIFQLTSLQLRQPLMGPCIEQSMEIILRNFKSNRGTLERTIVEDKRAFDSSEESWQFQNLG